MTEVPTWARIGAAGVSLASLPLLLWLARRASTATTAPPAAAVTFLTLLTSVGALVWPAPLLLAGLPLLVFGVPAAAVDLREHRLPNLLTIPLAVGAVIALTIAALVTGQDGDWVRAVAGAGAYAGLLLVQFLISPSTGPGDVKYAIGLGACLGWAGWTWLLGGVIAAYGLCLLGVAAVMIARWRRIRGPVPLGPAMYVGTVLALTAAALSP